MKDLVSIVIPMYNSEKTIYRCLESVCNQTYKNLEIIIVDDGSIDNGSYIVQEIQKKDVRVKYYYQDNRGPSLARNKGIELSRGEFLVFVDADDTIVESMVEEFLDIKENEKVELVIANRIGIRKNKKGLSRNIKEIQEKKLSSKESIKKDFFGLLNSGCINTIWGKLYNLDIIKRQKIRMEDDLDMGEDLQFNLSYIKEISSIYVLNKPLYIYYQNDSYLTNKFRENMFVKRKKAINLFYEFLREEKLNTDIIPYLYLKLFFSCVIQAYQHPDKMTTKQRRKEIKKNLERPEMKSAMRKRKVTNVQGEFLRILVSTKNVYIIEYSARIMLFIKKRLGERIKRISI